MKKETEKKVKKSKSTEKCILSKWINLGTLLIGIILLVIGIFAKSVAIPFKLIGILLVWGSCIAYAIRSNKLVIVKSIIWTALIAILSTWLFSYGAYQGEMYTDYGLSRVGLNDLPTILYYMVYFVLDKMLYLLALAGFYGVLSLTKGYRKIVTDCAKKLKANKMAVSIAIMIVLMLLTGILTNTLVILFFIPFILSIYAKMGVDKFTAFLTTFGAILFGLIAAPWGTDGLYWFNYYIGTTLKDGFTLRLIIEAFILMLAIVSLIIRAKKLDNSKDTLEVIEDVYEVESLNERANKLPVIIVFSLMAILMILGYVDWAKCFNIEAFSKFHEWLVGLTIGDDVPIFSYILGSSAKMFGSWDVATFVTVIIVFAIIIGLVYRIKIVDFLTAFGDGMKKMLKPICVFVITFGVFVVMYMTPVIPGITNWLLGLSETFNPYLTMITAFISSIFHADLGYTGYSVGQFLTTAYADNISVAHTIYITMYGLAQLLLPTGGLLVLGLVTTKVSYKDWLKYIWKYALIVLLIVIITITIATFA